MPAFRPVLIFVLLFAAAQVPAQAPAGLPSFSGDISVTSNATTSPFKEKIFSNGQKIRLDMSSGDMLSRSEGTSIIIDLTAHSRYVLMHAQKMYIETDTESDEAGSAEGGIPQIGPYNPDSPCANQGGVTCTKAGIEVVNGRVCDKWIYAGNTEKQTMWLDQALHVSIKTVQAGGITSSLENLHLGPQDPNLFAIPKDYRKYDASAIRGNYLGFLPYSLLLYSPLSLILRAICIIHWIRRRPNTYWLWILIIGGTVGALVYIAIEMVPDATLLRRSFAFIARNKRIRGLEVTVQDNPAPGNYEELGDLYLDAKKYEKARAAFDLAITGRTSHPSPFYGRALANIELKDYAAAEPDLQRVIAMDPKHDFQRAAGLLGYVLYKNGKNDEAGKVFAAVTQTSTISETLCHYAEFLAAQGDAAQARAWLQQVLNKKATLPLYLKRRERPWFRKAKSLMKNIPQGSKVGSQQATA